MFYVKQINMFNSQNKIWFPKNKEFSVFQIFGVLSLTSASLINVRPILTTDDCWTVTYL